MCSLGVVGEVSPKKEWYRWSVLGTSRDANGFLYKYNYFGAGGITRLGEVEEFKKRGGVFSLSP